jgi:hypothetical protein
MKLSFNSLVVFAGLALTTPAVASELLALEAEVTSLQETLTAEQRRASKLRAELEAARTQSEKLVGAAKPKVDDKAEAELMGLKEEFAAYKKEYRMYIRQKAPGMILKDQTLVERNFPQLKVRSVDDTWFTFEHEGGFARVFMGEVSQELRDLFACEEPVPPVPVVSAEVVAGVQAPPAEPQGDGSTNAVAAAGGGGGPYPVGTANFNPQLPSSNETMSIRSDVVLPPPGKTWDGNDIIYENGRAIVLLTKHLNPKYEKKYQKK